MPKLILIKHSHVEVAPAAAANDWHLSEKGKASCKPLADQLRPHLPFKLISSPETKAIETAVEIANHLGVSHEARVGLEEHDRSNVPVLATREFISLMELFFRRPGELVLGRETAEEALARFRAAIHDLITESPADNLAVITHGTVIALFLAYHTGKPGFQLWRQMGLPSFVVMSLPDHEVIECVDRIL